MSVYGTKLGNSHTQTSQMDTFLQTIAHIVTAQFRTSAATTAFAFAAAGPSSPLAFATVMDHNIASSPFAAGTDRNDLLCRLSKKQFTYGVQ